MVATSLVIWLGLAGLAGVISFAVLWMIGRWTSVPDTAMPASPDRAAVASFLFQDELMFDSHAGALPPAADSALRWSELRAWFADRFDDLPETLADLCEDRSLTRPAAEDGDNAQLTLLRTAHGTRVTLCDPPHAHPAERHEMLMAQRRLDATDKALQAAPYAIWRTAPDGTVLWQNAACEEAADLDKQALEMPEPGRSTVSRLSAVPAAGGRAIWYEVHSSADSSGVLHHANDITKVVTAEKMQKDFVQTLTKTFAYLTTGLAVFDRTRKLALFNPALVDLTSLPAEFLSGQPDLMAFFDRLRDRRVMPEPRSYASWRTQIGQVIESAEGGLYQETWSLPNDVTYRVTGRPHPDGAIAFLFEDITAEVMLSRRFRQQIDLRQSALDSLPDAVMIIGPDNVLSFCNSATTRLLGIDPDSCFADMTVPDLMRACATALPDPALWRDIEARLAQRAPARILRSVAAGPGHKMRCRVEPLPGGARMLALEGARKAAPPVAAAAKAS